MNIKNFKRSFSMRVAGSMGGDIRVDYYFEIHRGEYTFSMVGLREDYGGETSEGGSVELHSAKGSDAEDLVHTLSVKEVEMMISFEDLLDELRKTKRGYHVAENLSAAAFAICYFPTAKPTFKDLYPEEFKKQEVRNWKGNALVQYLRSHDYILPDEPVDTMELRPFLQKGVSRATQRKDLSALKAFLEIGEKDVFLPAYAFKSAGESEDMVAVMELAEIFGAGIDLKVRNVGYYYWEISNPFKILFETGFQAGALYLYIKDPIIENRPTRQKASKPYESYDRLTLEDWIKRAKAKGMGLLAELLEENLKAGVGIRTPKKSK